MRSSCSQVVPVTNAFFVLLILSAIYAILATNLYADRDSALFGSFSRSLFTVSASSPP